MLAFGGGAVATAATRSVDVVDEDAGPAEHVVVGRVRRRDRPRPAVRHAHRAARLRPPRGRLGRSRPHPPAGAGRPSRGDPAQPGRARRIGLRLRRQRRVGDRQRVRTAAPVRPRRLRPPRRATLGRHRMRRRRHHRRHRLPRRHPRHARGGAGPRHRRRSVRRGVPGEVRRHAALLLHHQHRPRHGLDPSRHRRRADLLHRHQLRHLPRRHLRPVVPGAGAGDGARRGVRAER